MRKKKKELKKSDVIVVVIFIGLVFLPNMVIPTINHFFGGKVSANVEKNNAPDLTLQTIDEFPSEYDEYYNNSLPFRDYMGKAWASLNYFVLNDSVNSGVVLGKVEDGDDKERWMFYNNKTDHSPIKDAQGLTDFTTAGMNEMIRVINDNTEKLKSNNIKLYYLVVPSKESIYKEMLPNSIDIYSDTTRADKFYKYAVDNGVLNLFYPKNELMDAKGSGQLYWKQDTHWNELGAGIVFKNIIGKIRKGVQYDFDFTFEKKQVDKDLSKTLNINGYFEDDVVSIKHKSGVGEYEVEQTTAKTSDLVISKNSGAPIKKTVMVVGDSYRNALKAFFMRTFEKCVFLHRNDYKSGMLQKYDVDIVVSEYVERYLPTIKNFKF